MKILMVKLSSLGDVLHNLPMVWDLRQAYPHAQIDWVVEEAYVNLLTPLKTSSLFKGIDHIIPLRMRAWKKNLKKGEFISSIQEFMEFRRTLQAKTYDLVIETQGLLKSAFISSLAKRSNQGFIYGLANQTEFSGYEPLARWFYSESIQVPFRSHAVDRSRYLAGAAMKLPPPDKLTNPPEFYPDQFIDQLRKPTQVMLDDQLSPNQLGFDIQQPYVLCFHSTAREAKRWNHKHWIEIGQHLAKQGMQVILPWGNEKEKAISNQMAKEIPEAIVPRAFSVETAFYLVAGAQLTIGVDTGLTHLAAILNCPTIELYCDSPRWKTEGYWSDRIHNLGDICKPPTVKEVLQSIRVLLAH